MMLGEIIENLRGIVSQAESKNGRSPPGTAVSNSNHYFTGM
ncbi:hypothetical protein [Candidatus Leptofilum sp.]